MKNNPFTSESYIAVWRQHFNRGDAGFKPDFIPDLSFVKHPYLPYFFNTGKTHTKGISYSLNPQNTRDCRGRVFLIYDVPTYFRLETGSGRSPLGLNTVKQYPGFLIELEKFADLTGYLSATFSKNTRTKLNKFRRRLELCFDIEYKMFFGEITHETYDALFNRFRTLLEKRFADKQTTNNNLASGEWEFYREVTFRMIMEKKAALFVVYDGSKPIGITLNYLSDDTIFDAITVFDIEYTKFHLGAVMLMALVEWSIKEKLTYFDFSKGYFDYKQRWASKAYDFECHIYYDTRSLKARTMAYLLKNYFRIKQALRDKKINEKWHRFTYRLKNKTSRETESISCIFEDLQEEVRREELEQIFPAFTTDRCLKHVVFEFLYLNNECFKDLKIYRMPDAKATYLLCGRNKEVLATVIS